MLGWTFLARFAHPLAAYNRLQAALLGRFLRRGGTTEEWVIRLAPAYRARYGWMCEEPVTVKARRTH